MAWNLITHLTNHMRRPRMGDKRAPSLWPSEASAKIVNEFGETEVVGKCKRAMFFRYVVDNYYYHTDRYRNWEPLVKRLSSEQTPPDQYLLWIWRAGELFEEHLISASKDSGVYIESQVPIWIPSHHISGKIDVVVINPETNKYSCVEVKSVYGYNADSVMGKPAKNMPGTPRDSNLMQIALYQYHYANNHQDFEEGRLVYGARDTGKFSEYRIKVVENDGTHYIKYQCIAPREFTEVTSPITINAILDSYAYVRNCVDNGTIPPRDFDAQYSDEKIKTLYERGAFNKADTERVQKRLEQIAQGKTKINKQIEAGDYQCGYCQFRNICYGENNQPKEI